MEDEDPERCRHRLQRPNPNPITTLQQMQQQYLPRLQHRFQLLRERGRTHPRKSHFVAVKRETSAPALRRHQFHRLQEYRRQLWLLNQAQYFLVHQRRRQRWQLQLQQQNQQRQLHHLRQQYRQQQLQQLQQQYQQHAVSCSPSNIDAHLHPLPLQHSSLSFQQQPNLQHHHQQQKANQLGVELEQPIPSLEDTFERLQPHQMVADHEAQEEDRVPGSGTTVQKRLHTQQWDYKAAAEVKDCTTMFEKQVHSFNTMSHERATEEHQTRKRLLVELEQAPIQEKEEMLIESMAFMESRKKTVGFETADSFIGHDMGRQGSGINMDEMIHERRNSNTEEEHQTTVELEQARLHEKERGALMESMKKVDRYAVEAEMQTAPSAEAQTQLGDSSGGNDMARQGSGVNMDEIIHGRESTHAVEELSADLLKDESELENGDRGR